MTLLLVSIRKNAKTGSTRSLPIVGSILAASLLCVFAMASRAQVSQKPMASDANPSFEVATIKPSNPDKPSGADDQMGHRVVMSNTTVLFLIGFAYDLHKKQIVGGPPWMESAKFDLDAVADTPGTPNLPQLKVMLRKLLTDRFQMTVHRDHKEMTAYVLTVAKGGPKLSKSQQEPNGLPRLMLQPGHTDWVRCRQQTSRWPTSQTFYSRASWTAL